MLSQKTMDIVKSTVPLLEERGVEITKHFYKILFENHPEVKPLFDMHKQKTGDQPKALATAVLAAAKNIENLEAMLPAVKSIAARHVAVSVKPEHYPIVGNVLLTAMQDVLGSDIVTPDVTQAWGEAYGVIADVFISVEKDMYASV